MNAAFIKSREIKLKVHIIMIKTVTQKTKNQNKIS